MRQAYGLFHHDLTVLHGYGLHVSGSSTASGLTTNEDDLIAILDGDTVAQRLT